MSATTAIYEDAIEEQLLELAEVTSLLRLSKTSVYDLMAAGEFPRPVRLTKRAVRWRVMDVREFVRSRLQDGDHQQLPPV